MGKRVYSSRVEGGWTDTEKASVHPIITGCACAEWRCEHTKAARRSAGAKKRSAKRANASKIVAAREVGPTVVPMADGNPASADWDRYSKDIDWSIQGLGAYRTDRKNRVLATSAAVNYRDNESSTAGRTSVKANTGKKLATEL